ncbi:hypothetical protein DVH05_014361 [Phytophthora capsici]|nr:hypothetical protein DVH05_014251 [Phytophthora capsici]KAG1698988.1 hypothetical protein DVH05_014361 [Phytophthora capsici]
MQRAPTEQDGYEEANPTYPADTNPGHSVMKPPSSLGLPSYYTQYEEDHADASDQVPVEEEPLRKRARRTGQIATSTEASEATSAQSNQSESKAPTRKSLSDGTAIKETTRRARKIKMAGMRKSSAISMDKAATEAVQTVTKFPAKPNEKTAAKKAKRGAKSGAMGGTKGDRAADTKEVKAMKWTVQLTTLAIEARFQNKHILKKFGTENSNTKAQRAIWEDTINVFQQRALIENAWGDDDEPRNHEKRETPF